MSWVTGTNIAIVFLQSSEKYFDNHRNDFSPIVEKPG